MRNLNSDMKAPKIKSVLFFLSTIWWLDARELSGKMLLNKRKKNRVKIFQKTFPRFFFFVCLICLIFFCFRIIWMAIWGYNRWKIPIFTFFLLFFCVCVRRDVYSKHHVICGWNPWADTARYVVNHEKYSFSNLSRWSLAGTVDRLLYIMLAFFRAF